MGTNERKRREDRRQAIILILFIIAAVAIGYGVVSFLDSQSRIHLRFRRPDGSMTRSFSLEVARTRQEQAKGLMYRNELAPDTGMIFIYDHDEVQSFWMRNTYIPLDMVFIDNERTVIGILADVPILNDDPRSVGKPGRFVVELPAGTAAREKITVGAVAEW